MRTLNLIARPNERAYTVSESPNPMHVPRHMRQRPVGTRTRVFAVIGLLIGLWQILSWLQGASIGKGIWGLFIIAISLYWLFTRDKAS